MNKRADIKTGFLCNNNCLFCVQADNKCVGNRSFEDIKKDIIDTSKRCDSIVLTGGEVTIRKDFLDIVSFAKSLGFKTIQIQTNARMFSDFNFAKKTVTAGANEFAPALHGFCSEQHDFLTNANGSFKQTVKGIINLKKLNQKVITNTVITRSNYESLPKITNLLVKLKVDQIQLAFVHHLGNAKKKFYMLTPKMSMTIKYIQESIRIAKKHDTNIMIEAIPMCILGKYYEFASEFYIPETEIRGVKSQNTNNYKKIRVEQGKIKFSKCLECIYNNICEGPWREYPIMLSDKEFVPIKSKNEL